MKNVIKPNVTVDLINSGEGGGGGAGGSMTEVGPAGQGRPTYIPNKHETLTQRWFTVGPTVNQRWANVSWTG